MIFKFFDMHMYEWTPLEIKKIALSTCWGCTGNSRQPSPYTSSLNEPQAAEFTCKSKFFIPLSEPPIISKASHHINHVKSEIWRCHWWPLSEKTCMLDFGHLIRTFTFKKILSFFLIVALNEWWIEIIGIHLFISQFIGLLHTAHLPFLGTDLFSF